MHYKLHFQRTHIVVLILVLPSFLTVAALMLTLALLPQVIESKTFFLLFTFGLVIAGMLLTLLLYKRQGLRNCEVVLGEYGIDITIERGSLFYPHSIYIDWNNLEDFSFNDLNGEYTRIKMKNPVMVFNLTKNVFTVSTRADTGAAEYTKFTKSLYEMATAKNPELRGKMRSVELK